MEFCAERPGLCTRGTYSANRLADFAQIGLNADGRREIEFLGKAYQDGLQLAHGVEIQITRSGSGFNRGRGIFNQQAGICRGLADPQGQLVAAVPECM